MLTDDREAFIKYAEIPADEESQVLVAYSLTEFTGFANHWVIAFQTEEHGSFTTTWRGDDYRSLPFYEDAEHTDGANAARAAAFGYALGRKES